MLCKCICVHKPGCNQIRQTAPGAIDLDGCVTQHHKAVEREIQINLNIFSTDKSNTFLARKIGITASS